MILKVGTYSWSCIYCQEPSPEPVCGNCQKIRYEGKVRGFLAYALPELRKCAMRGWTLRNDAEKVQQALRKAETKDLCSRLACRGPKTA